MKPQWAGRWRGRTVACIASGPSLTAEDCEAVRASGHPAIVTNTTFRLCPWAEVLYAFDAKWWRLYLDEVDAVFTGQRLTNSTQKLRGVSSMASTIKFRPYGNSGAAAVSLAIFGGAAKVVMVGFDCKRDASGASHWHGEHPAVLGPTKSLEHWPRKFAQLAQYARRERCSVINASRETALTCFPRGVLADEL